MTFEQFVIQERGEICELPMCCNKATVVLDPHEPTMLAVCQRCADLDELPVNVRHEYMPKSGMRPQTNKETPQGFTRDSFEEFIALLIDDQRNHQAAEWDQLQAEEHEQRELQAETDDKLDL